MIPESQQALAIAYLLGDLDPAQTARFEAEMQANAELRQFVDELRESTAALALAVPPQIPPLELRSRILAGLPASPAEAVRPPGKVVFGPWRSPLVGGLAACLVLALGFALYQNHVARDELKDGAAKAALFAKTIDGMNRELAQFRSASETQLKQIAELQARDSLARMRIATLAAQVDTYQRAGVVVVWDDLKQQGLAKLVNLPKPAAGKDYQLWIVDPKYPNPVNGGILTVTDEAGTVASFKPDQPVTSATAFAISVEKTGGVPKAEGPIVFVGK
jgi:anti-sigma-K factor RskA